MEIGDMLYIYTYVYVIPHLSSVGMVLHNEGGVKC